MLEIICQRAPDQPHRGNEDTFVAVQRDDAQPRYILAAIDGATTRAHFAPLTRYLELYRDGITPAALAAGLTRDSILAHIATGIVNPRELLLTANQSLRVLLENVSPSIFDYQKILEIEPQHTAILDDPRKIRLFLPSAVVTLVTVDTARQTLNYAHLGDTQLMLYYQDGRVEVPTYHGAETLKNNALPQALELVRTEGISMIEAVSRAEIIALDRDARLRHNYVDAQGRVVLEKGDGVIDGLPEMADYIQEGEYSLAGIEFLAVMSDGFEFPSPLEETWEATQTRFLRMAQHIHQKGAWDYLQLLRDEECADSTHEKYPRFKHHDDATGIVLHLSDL
jgi:hypothetical protein